MESGITPAFETLSPVLGKLQKLWIGLNNPSSDTAMALLNNIVDKDFLDILIDRCVDLRKLYLCHIALLVDFREKDIWDRLKKMAPFLEEFEMEVTKLLYPASSSYYKMNHEQVMGRCRNLRALEFSRHNLKGSFVQFWVFKPDLRVGLREVVSGKPFLREITFHYDLRLRPWDKRVLLDLISILRRIPVLLANPEALERIVLHVTLFDDLTGMLPLTKIVDTIKRVEIPPLGKGDDFMECRFSSVFTGVFKWKKDSVPHNPYNSRFHTNSLVYNYVVADKIFM